MNRLSVFKGHRKIRLANLVTLLCLLAGAALLAAPSGKTPEPIVVHSQDLVWTERPSGVKVAVLQGDPALPGPFTLRLQYPAGYRKGPHYHPGDAYVTVLSGGYFRGYGSTFDESKGIELKPGTFSVNPSRVSHYEWTTQPAMLQVHAEGPWTTVYVDAEGKPVDAAAKR